MTIKIEQKCDKCKRTRELRMNRGATASTLSSHSQAGGWRQIDHKDICNSCLADLLGVIDAEV